MPAAAPTTPAQILAIGPPPDSGRRIRRETRKQIAAEIRALFKRLGIKGISVTSPSYSMAQGVDIDVPPTDPAHVQAAGPHGHDYQNCPVCQERNRAVKHLESLILAAFPDLDNRGDSRSDHFDYRLSIH